MQTVVVYNKRENYRTTTTSYNSFSERKEEPKIVIPHECRKKYTYIFSFLFTFVLFSRLVFRFVPVIDRIIL